MDDNARLHLQQMIHANQVEDMTPLIRELKHSVLLKQDISALLDIKKKHPDDPAAVVQDAMTQCTFLFTYYTDIFNKIRKDEIDLSLLFVFLEVLRKIEDGELDQHEGSFHIGKILKEMYVDSALKKADKINKEYEEPKETDHVKPLDIQWKKYKLMKEDV
jgi:hypothetical protein